MENPKHQTSQANQSLSSRPYVQAFANYALLDPPPKFILKTEAHAAQTHLYSNFKTTWITLMPYGYLLLYPDWLVFLSPSKKIPGALPDSHYFYAKETLIALGENWKFATRLDTVGSLIRMTYEHLSTSEHERTKKLIANQNSLFIPLNTILAAEQFRDKLAQVYMKIKTKDNREFLFAPNLGLALPGGRYWRACKSVLGFKWEPKLQSALQEAVKHNKEAGQ